MQYTQKTGVLQECNKRGGETNLKWNKNVENSVEKEENPMAKGVQNLQVACKNVEKQASSTAGREIGICLNVEKHLPFKKILDKKCTISEAHFPTFALTALNFV